MLKNKTCPSYITKSTNTVRATTTREATLELNPVILIHKSGGSDD